MCVWVVTFEMFVLKHMNESLLWSFETHKFGALQGTEKYREQGNCDWKASGHSK